MKSVILFDHDGVLVDTEPWYFRAGEQACAEIGLVLEVDRYLAAMQAGRGTWEQARSAGVDEATIDRLRDVRDSRYQEFLRTEEIEIEGVREALLELSPLVRMAIVTTAKGVDFDLIHANRDLVRFMELVLVREDYERAKPHPEPYLTAERLGVSRSQALVVEDSARGLAAAVAAGIDCAVVDNEFTRGQDFSGATHRIASLRELRAIVLGAS